MCHVSQKILFWNSSAKYVNREMANPGLPGNKWPLNQCAYICICVYIICSLLAIYCNSIVAAIYCDSDVVAQA